MPSFRLITIAAAVLLTGVFISGCSDDNDDSTLNIEVGVVQSFSGAGGLYGESVLRGIELAIDEINEAEDGVTMTLAQADDASDVETGKQAFEALIDGGATAIIGPTLSNVGLEAMPVAQQARVPVLGATTTAQGITEIGDYIFRVALTEAIVVPATLERVNSDEPIDQATLIFDSTDAFSRSSADAMRSGIEAIGATLFSEIDVSQTALETQFETLRAASGLTTFLITPLADQSVGITRALRQERFEQIFIGGNGFNTPGMTEAGQAIEGAYVGAAWNANVDNEASQRFVQAYADRHGSEPDLFAAQGYSSVYLLLDAVKRAGSTDRDAVRDALASIKDVQTPLGNVTMSESREALHSPVVQRFEDGELVALPE